MLNPVTIAGVAAAVTVMASSIALAERVNCVVTKGESGGFKYAAGKCAFESNPHNYDLNLTIWESRDPEGYKKMVQGAGQRFSCEATEGRSQTVPGRILTYYEFSDCR